MTAPRTRERDDDVTDGAALTLSQSAVDTWQPLIMAIPEADDSEATERILLQIAQSMDATELDAPWSKREGLKFYRDEALIVTGLSRRASDYEGGFPYYLLIEATVKGTGEKIMTTAGSIGVMGQLVKAHQLGALPLEVIPRRSEKQTKAGYYAWHLEIVR